jgi:hypothetical protein
MMQVPPTEEDIWVYLHLKGFVRKGEVEWDPDNVFKCVIIQVWNPKRCLDSFPKLS